MKKDEKDKANERKMSPAPIRLSRPKTAPAKSKKVRTKKIQDFLSLGILKVMQFYRNARMEETVDCKLYWFQKF